MAQTNSWDVRVEDDTIIVELREGVELNKKTGEKINEQFTEAAARRQTNYQLTLVKADDPMGSGLFEEVKRGGKIAADNGITRWAIVVDERIQGMAIDSKLEDIETAVFESRDEAEDWFES